MSASSTKETYEISKRVSDRSFAARAPYAADVGGKPERVDVIASSAQPSGAFRPIWLTHEAGLFKK